MLKPSGNFSYFDAYDVQYIVEWTTSYGILDITVETRQPFVWNKPRTGYIKNNKLFVYGMITVSRQAIRLNDNTIIADGHSNNLGYIYVNPVKPHDVFKHLCNYMIVDDITSLIESEPIWTTVDGETEWADLDGNGDIASITNSNLEWLSVW